MSITTSFSPPAVLLVSAAALIVSGCGVNIDFGNETSRRVETEAISAERIVAIDIATDDGAVDVVATDRDDIRIRSIFEESKEGDGQADIAMEGDRLVVRGNCSGRPLKNCSVAFEVEVPDGIDVKVRTDNGRISIGGATTHVDVQSDNGRLVASDLAATDVRARTDNGRIDLRFDMQPNAVEASSDNGRIDVKIPNDGDPYDVSASSDNGRITIDVRDDDAAVRHITADTDNGAIEVGYIST